jgi:hypothetical protein
MGFILSRECGFFGGGVFFVMGKEGMSGGVEDV